MTSTRFAPKPPISSASCAERAVAEHDAAGQAGIDERFHPCVLNFLFALRTLLSKNYDAVNPCCQARIPVQLTARLSNESIREVSVFA